MLIPHSTMLGHDRLPGVVPGLDFEKNVFGPAVSLIGLHRIRGPLSGLPMLRLQRRI